MRFEDEKEAHIEWRTKVLEERIERFYRDNTAINAQSVHYLREEHQNKMNEIRGMQPRQWSDFVRGGYDEPLALSDQKKAKEFVATYTTSQRDFGDDVFEQRRSNAEFEYDVMNMSAGELRDAFQTQVALNKPRDDMPKMMLEASKAICTGLARAEVFNTQGEERILQLFWQRAQMIKDSGLSEELVDHVASENDLDDFSIQKLRVAVRAHSIKQAAPHIKHESDDPDLS